MNGSLDRPTGTVKEEICELSFHLERDKLQQKARWPVNNAGACDRKPDDVTGEADSA